MNVKELIEMYGVTQCKLARVMGYKPSLVSRQKKEGFRVFIDGDDFVVVNPSNIHKISELNSD